jgi:hypothetical protein
MRIYTDGIFTSKIYIPINLDSVILKDSEFEKNNKFSIKLQGKNSANWQK